MGLAVIAVEEVPVFVAEVGVAVSVTGVGEAVTVSWVELVKVKISDFVAEVEELLGALSITWKMMFPVLGIVFHKAEVGVANIVESVEMDVSVA